jgi:hypothetical protein
MQSITSTMDLKRAIRRLEAQQQDEAQLLKEQFDTAYQSFKPANIIKSNLLKMASSNKIISTVLWTGLGLASGYFSKRLIVGASGGIFKRLLGSAIQMAVSAYSAKQAYNVQTNGHSLFYRLFHTKSSNSI